MNKNGINVLSLFDGISCGQIALQRAGIKVNKYFSSEIDKDAIKVTQHNWPNTIQLGDIKKLNISDLPKIDMIIGGSPCQNFSCLSYFNGKTPTGLKGEKSKLFLNYLKVLTLLKEQNKNIFFLLENVNMSKKSKRELDSFLGVEGVLIDSQLVSYQRRKRVYWTNWNFNTPKDKAISFQDYKEQGDHLQKYKLNKTKSRIRMWANGQNFQSSQGSCANITFSDKVFCLTTKQDRCPNSGLIEYEDFCRFLSQKELEQAQTIPIDYTSQLSYYKACKVLGNGWTVDVISHIFSFIPKQYLS